MAALSGYFIGADSLLIECCEIFRTAGHDVRGIVSDAPMLAGWARDHDIAHMSLSQWKEPPADAFDFLFAITHLQLIPDDQLARAAIASINFHDGPLPRYAGLNGPAWAVLNREADYGISWHLIEPRVDAGRLLLQRRFELTEADTAMSTNARCFESAIDSFAELVGRLNAGMVEGRPQRLAERSYFGRHDRPDAACVIDWRRPAHAIGALVRALDFGRYRNPLGLAKLRAGDTWLAVRRAHVVAGDPAAPPGRVLRADAAGVTIQTGAGGVRIEQVSTLTGAALDVGDVLCSTRALYVPEDDDLLRFTQMNERMAFCEPYWRRELGRLEALELPYPAGAPASEHHVTLPGGMTVAAGVAALLAYLARLAQKECFHVGLAVTAPAFAASLVSRQLPLPLRCATAEGFPAFERALEEAIVGAGERGTFLLDLAAREPSIVDGGLDHPVLLAYGDEPQPPDCRLCVRCPADADAVGSLDLGLRLEAAYARRLLDGFAAFAASVAASPGAPLGSHALMSASERDKVVHEWNRTDTVFESTMTVHGSFERQVEATPHAPAIVFGEETLSYANLNRRANQLAHYLLGLGVGADQVIGISVERGPELPVAVLAVLKTGAAYVPMDPDFPVDRLMYMANDSDVRIVLTTGDADKLLAASPAVKAVALDRGAKEIAACAARNPAIEVSAADLAYVIYTSGSTGNPKGVMIEHRNVVNFFTGMDARIPHDAGACWLSVTSLSFDISVLELFWTLTHGFKVVLFKDPARNLTEADPKLAVRPIDISLFMWGSDGSAGNDKYRLMLDAARFGDRHGFSAIWTPERHFDKWGGLFPNPAVTAAAIAAVTSNIHIRGGSCVVPLHHPIRIAEDWSVVDNLSHGRVGIAAASGWQPRDFVLRPDGFDDNKTKMFEAIDQVQALWRGASVAFAGPNGNVEVATQPRPIQPSLPIWITTAGSEATFKKAGETGANLLTHLLGQSVEQVAEKIAIYRAALQNAGYDPASRTVTLMVHTLVGQDTATVKELVREPLKAYLRGSVGLLADNVWAFPTLRRPDGANAALDDINLEALDEQDVEAIVDFAFERYFGHSGLFGAPNRCLQFINRLKAIDVDEIGCLIDYGIDDQIVMDSLPALADLLQRANSGIEMEPEPGFAVQVARNGVSHLQCTPSMARLFSSSAEDRQALSTIPHLLVGGEALPRDLAADLLQAGGAGRLTNLYGPTETTIWSSTQAVEPGAETITIGRPIANTRMYILDRHLEPLPVGVAGDLYIGGAGVARGYFGRPDLTAERFVPDPFHAGGRIYKTGDLARFDDEGVLEYLGRADFQVKLRGYRIELGEVEQALLDHPDIKNGVVMVREDIPGDARLVAYIVPGATATVDDGGLRSHLRAALPEYMTPSMFVRLAALPLTPNGKIDRRALPAPRSLPREQPQEPAPPGSDLAAQILWVWQDILGLDDVGIDENFFDVGGNSLLLVAVHRRLKELLARPLALTELYRYPTIRTVADHIETAPADTGSARGSDRAERRKKLQGARRLRREGR